MKLKGALCLLNLEGCDVLRRKKRVLGFLAAVLFALSSSIAFATAYGIEYFGAVEYEGYAIPSGQLAHLIEGKGYNIETDGANFASVGNICDPSMKFTYGDGSFELKGDVHWGCSNVGQWKYQLDWDAPRGDACAELWAKNWKFLVARQCHYVYG